MASLHRFLEYTIWAKSPRLGIAEIRASSDPARRILAHIVTVERLWFCRLEGKETSDIPVWPEWTLTGADVVAPGIVGAMMGGVAAAACLPGPLGFFRILAASPVFRRRPLA